MITITGFGDKLTRFLFQKIKLQDGAKDIQVLNLNDMKPKTKAKTMEVVPQLKILRLKALQQGKTKAGDFTDSFNYTILYISQNT
jgi:hypothetical protein